jgi:hypothetical protein
MALVIKDDRVGSNLGEIATHTHGTADQRRRNKQSSASRTGQ